MSVLKGKRLAFVRVTDKGNESSLTDWMQHQRIGDAMKTSLVYRRIPNAISDENISVKHDMTDITPVPDQSAGR